MAPSNLKKAIGAVKDQTAISLALVGGASALSDLEIAIVKATRHEEYPAEERHIREVLGLMCSSRIYLGAGIAIISRRLSKTRNWIVALKTLMLIHRMLQEGDPIYDQEIFFATKRGTRLLNMSDFRDTSRSNSWDYSAFVRTYALYLDEVLELRVQWQRGRHKPPPATCNVNVPTGEDVGPTPVRILQLRDMDHVYLFSRIQHLMQLIERFLACRPRGPAQDNRVVLMALYPIVRESFHLYYEITEILAIFIERFTSFKVTDTVTTHEIFSRVSKQFDELDMYYDWCKHAGLTRSSEYPIIEKISQKKLEVMDEYIQDKSSSANKKKAVFLEHKEEIENGEKTNVIVEENMNEIKALPAPEGFSEEEKKEEEVEKVEERKDENALPEKEPDLLDLTGDELTTEQHGDKLALALFDGAEPVGTGTDPGTSITPWEAYKNTENWEIELVQTASHLSNQKASLPGGFDTLVLDGMYQQGTLVQAMASSGCQATGSASSVAFGSAGRPATLALPAPEGGDMATAGYDPFAASLAVPPPSYVQMSEMEKKQKLLVEEQILWQQYSRDGMQGNKFQGSSYPYYNVGGYTNTY